MEREIKNAKISSTMLGTEDHGIFTFMIMLDYNGAGQGFGGYALDEPKRDAEDEFIGRYGTAGGMQRIMSLLDVLEVQSWEELKGQFIRADADRGKVYRVGHLLKDRWFSLEDEGNRE